MNFYRATGFPSPLEHAIVLFDTLPTELIISASFLTHQDVLIASSTGPLFNLQRPFLEYLCLGERIHVDNLSTFGRILRHIILLNKPLFRILIEAALITRVGLSLNDVYLLVGGLEEEEEILVAFLGSDMWCWCYCCQEVGETLTDDRMRVILRMFS